MKLESLSVIFVLGIAGMANGLCLVRNTTIPDEYWYQCFRSIDYLEDLNRSPIDVHGHTVSNSKIKTIRNGSYSRLGKSLTVLAVICCGVEEIEDKAFQGLNELHSLSLMGNKLEVIKSAWFEGLSGLKAVFLQSNRFKRVEDKVFSVLPPLNVLDIANNKLTCLPTGSFGNFNTTELHFRPNPLTWKCQVLIFDWLKKTGTRGDYLDPSPNSVDPPYDLAKICVAKSPSPQLEEEFLNKCAEETTRQLLPPIRDYTVGQACEFLKGKPSPFLDCNK